MNTDGGTLLISVDDAGRTVGLANDMKLVQRKNTDGYVLWLTRLMSDCIGNAAAMNVTITFEKVDDHDVCRVDVRPSRTSVFVNAPKSRNRDEFYVRMNNQTEQLSMQDTLEYTKARWG